MARQLIPSGSPYESVVGFSRAVRVGNFVAVGGTAPLDANGETVSPGDAGAQARRCIEIIRRALEEANGDEKKAVELFNRAFEQGFVANQVNGIWRKAQEVPGTAALNKNGQAATISVSCASAGNCSMRGPT